MSSLVHSLVQFDHIIRPFEMLLELKHTFIELKQQLNHFFILARDDTQRVVDVYVVPYISNVDDDDNKKVKLRS